MVLNKLQMQVALREGSMCAFSSSSGVCVCVCVTPNHFNKLHSVR